MMAANNKKENLYQRKPIKIQPLICVQITREFIQSYTDKWNKIDVQKLENYNNYFDFLLTKHINKKNKDMFGIDIIVYDSDLNLHNIELNSFIVINEKNKIEIYTEDEFKTKFIKW